jgi:3'-phosphoadenosine 5'-phosphosulfate sulfotransferase (PAPS reductase)/FAD synthetase
MKKGFPKDLLRVTGVRWGESTNRDGKLEAAGCSAGGECGVKELSSGENIYGPIINWSVQDVFDWLSGNLPGSVGEKIQKVNSDLIEIATGLLDVYGVKKGMKIGDGCSKSGSVRFGCIGCPALVKDKVLEKNVLLDAATYKPLKRLYHIWKLCRLQTNRLKRPIAQKKIERTGKIVGFGLRTFEFGPMRMDVRQELFHKVMQIQNESGVEIMTKADIAFIKQCWVDKVYPRGWDSSMDSSMPEYKS